MANYTAELLEDLMLEQMLIVQMRKMKDAPMALKSDKNSPPPPPRITTTGETVNELKNHILGQNKALNTIAPYVTRYRAGMQPMGRPAGIFMLLGPTGTGKTATVEALAEVLHGSRRHVLRVDCGEYQMDHEVAKLIGAPPGYLGHRETHPVLTQARLAAITSDQSSLAIVLFDEIEKAAPSMRRILLGVLDKGQLRLGDNNVVNFERSLIFMTSNVGAAELQREGRMGLLAQSVAPDPMRHLRREFSPEFLGRVDEFVRYESLSTSILRGIVRKELKDMQMFVGSRTVFETQGPREIHIQAITAVETVILSKAGSAEFGARDIKRLVDRLIMRPAVELFVEGAREVYAYVKRGEIVVKESMEREVAA